MVALVTKRGNVITQKKLLKALQKEGVDAEKLASILSYLLDSENDSIKMRALLLTMKDLILNGKVPDAKTVENMGKEEVEDWRVPEDDGDSDEET